MRPDDYVHAVREDPTRRGLLYAATQHGVYISYDDGALWQALNMNLPDVPVADLIVEGNELVIGTHGRGFWVLDNIAPLRQVNAGYATVAAKLYQPPTGVRSGTGVTLSWWLKAPSKRARLEILDSAGATLRSFEVDTVPRGGRDTTAAPPVGFRGGGRVLLPNAAGLNRVSWDLRAEGASTFPGMILWGAGTNGPVVPPGRYTARLTADEQVLSTAVQVVRNPRITDVTDADLHAQYAFSRRVRDKVTEANDAVIAIRRVKAQVEDRLKKSDDGQLKSVAARLTANASGVEENVYQVRNRSGQDPLNFPIKVNNRLANLMSMAERGDGRPTTNMPEIFGILTAELKTYTDRLARVWAEDLAALNGELARLGLKKVDSKCAVVEGCGPPIA
jgi:hypothetical protein